MLLHTRVYSGSAHAHKKHSQRLVSNLEAQASFFPTPPIPLDLPSHLKGCDNTGSLSLTPHFEEPSIPQNIFSKLLTKSHWGTCPLYEIQGLSHFRGLIVHKHILGIHMHIMCLMQSTRSRVSKESESLRC